MSFITGEDIASSIVSHLEANITDPDQARASTGKKWIYDDLPRLDLTSYPRISVIVPVSPSIPFDLGYNYDLVDIDIQIAIFVKIKQKLSVNGKILRDTEILSYLTSEVISAMKQKITITGAINSRPVFVTGSRERPTNNGLYIKVLHYKIKILR